MMMMKNKENKEKIRLNKQISCLAGNRVGILETDQEDVEDGANVNLDSQRKGKAAVLKTSINGKLFFCELLDLLMWRSLILKILWVSTRT